jgi:hypothetical protein
MAKYRRDQFSEITLLKKEWLLAMAMPKLGNIYARNSMWEQRVQMMKWWADYLDELRSGSAATAHCALRA